MNFQEFEKKLNSNKLQYIYILVGEETFFKKEAIKLILKKAGEKSFFREISAKDGIKIPDLVSDLLSDTLFGDISLIFIKDTQEVASELGPALKEYLKNPNPSSVLVLEMDKLDGRSSLAIQAKDKGEIVQCDKLYDRPKPWLRIPPWDNELTAWIQRRVQVYSKKIEKKVAFELSKLVGNYLSELDEEIGKVVIYIGDRQEITTSDIHLLVKARNRTGVFPFLDSITSRDIVSSIRNLNNLFSEGIVDNDGRLITQASSIALILIGALQRKFKQFWKIRHGGEIPSNLPAFVQKQIGQEAERFSIDELNNYIQLLLDTDYALKSSPISAEIIMERLVIAILMSKGKA